MSASRFSRIYGNQKKRRKTPSSSGEGAVVDTGAATLLAWAAFDIFCWFLLGLFGITVLWLLHDPWIAAGEFLVSSDSPIWGVKSVSKIWIIGGWLQQQMLDTVLWVGTSVMAVINVIQLIALLEQTGCLTIKKAWAISAITFFAIAAWLLELWVAINANPIYIGGWPNFIADLPVPSVRSFLFPAIGKNIFLMFMFEASLYFGVIMILSLKNNKARSKAKARAKAAS